MPTRILYFGAPRCGPCRTLAPILDELAARYPDLPIEKIDADQNPDTAVRFSVRGLPTLTAVRGDDERFDELLGFPGKRKVEEWFARVAAAG